LKQYDFIPESLSQSDFNKLGRLGLTIGGFEYPIPTPAPAVTINCGYIHLEGPPDDLNCYINTIDNYNIDVGDGGNVRIEVDYYMHCPGAADDGYVNISCQDAIDTKHTGVHSEGTLTITLWFDDDETFNVKLCLLYMDWWNTDEKSRIEKFSHCSTKEYEPPNSPPYRPDRPSGPTPIKVDEEHTYTSSATDPDGNQVYLKFDWGDGDDSGWLGPKTSGSVFSAPHRWDEQGGYDIRCIAKDYPYEEESKWSYPLHISVPQPNP